MAVTHIPVEVKYKKESGLWVVDIDSVQLPANFTLKQRSIVYIPPKQFGGNHKHPRTEAFIGHGSNLIIRWQDSNGAIHEEVMDDGQQPKLFIVEPQTPHVIINQSVDSPAALLEFADNTENIVERVDLV